MKNHIEKSYLFYFYILSIIIFVSLLLVGFYIDHKLPPFSQTNVYEKIVKERENLKDQKILHQCKKDEKK